MKPSNVFKWIILSFLGFILTVGAVMYYRLGVYKEPVLEGVVKKSFYFLYKTHIGPYHKVIQTLNEVEDFAKKQNISCPQTFGEYLDNPDHIDPERLKSHVGCVLEEATYKGLPSLPQGLSTVYKSEKEYLKITFDGSPAIGPMKVYPMAKTWVRNKAGQEFGSSIEVYNILDGGEKIVTEYYFPLNP